MKSDTQDTKANDRERLMKIADELTQLSEETKAKFDHLEAERRRMEERYKWFSVDRKNFTKLPPWLWIPVVCLLCALFLIAIIQTSR